MSRRCNPNVNSGHSNKSPMLTLPKGRLLWALPMLCCVRNFVSPFSGVGIVPRVVCPNLSKVSQTRFQRKNRSDPATGRTVGLPPRAEDDDNGLADGWNTWEFGSWKVNSHEELAGEEAARAEIPMVMPKLMGPGAALVHQTAEELNRTIEILQGYSTEGRIMRMKDVLDQRTSSTRLLFENPSNPNNVCRFLSWALLRNHRDYFSVQVGTVGKTVDLGNAPPCSSTVHRDRTVDSSLWRDPPVWACLRTMDSFGVQHAHVVADPNAYTKKARRKTMCTAMGSQKWLTLHGHDSTQEAVASLKTHGFQVMASDLSPSAVPISDIDWSVPSAIVLGNEDRGITDSMRKLADATFSIPMRGFAQSFNMSAACSIILAHLSALRALRHGDVSDKERKEITAAWLMQSVRGSDEILGRHGIHVPDEAPWSSRNRSKYIAGFSVR